MTILMRAINRLAPLYDCWEKRVMRDLTKHLENSGDTGRATKETERPSVLVIAEAANPEWVSVPLVGWSMATALRDVADVHIVTQIRNREAFLRAGLVEDTDFTAIDTEKIANPAYKLSSVLRGGAGKGWTTLAAINAVVYPYFEHLIWRRFQARLKVGEFDLVHRVTPLSPTMQSPIAPKLKRIGVPFVVGPLNGGVPWPEGFDRERRKEREWLSYVRNAYKMLPGRGATLKAASAIIAGSRHTASEVPEAYADKIAYMPENGIDPARFNLKVSRYDKAPLRACFIGRFVPYKGPDMLLEAATPLLRAGRLHLDFIGDGPMRDDLEAQIARDGLGDAVTMHGWVAHEDLQTVAVQSSVLAFPSVREFGGGVVLEAMALGLVPLIVDYAGPGELVDEAVGFKTPIGSRADIIRDVRAALEKLISPNTDLAALGVAARERAFGRFAWSAKAAAIRQLYDDILSG